MEKFIVPEIAPLFYNGQKVLTINQMSVLFKCEGANIRVAFSRHRKNFVENEDYFYLNYEQLAKFKAANRQFTSVKYNRYAPFSNLASSLYLWAKSGVEKLAKIIGTDEAKLIYSAMQHKYITPVTPPAPKEISNAKLSAREKLEWLKFLIENTDDKKLRDELIQAAFCLII